MKILALSNAVTDVIQNVSDQYLEELGLEKGCFQVAEQKHSDELVKGLENCVKIPGGAAANVAAGASFLGARTGLIGVLGNDSVGELYVKDMERFGIENHITMKDGRSGVCHTLITPDGERTFVLDFGVANDFDVKKEDFNEAGFFLTTGYEFSSREDVIRNAISTAKENGVKFCFDLADPGIVKDLKESIMEIVSGAHIVFANENEAKEFTQKEDPKEALEELSKLADIVVVKLGDKGSLIKKKEEVHEISVVPVEKLVNTNGAGDAYAAGFLSAYVSGRSLKEAGEQASEFAAKICGCEGARINN